MKFIYFIKAKNFVKIGISKNNPKYRMADLQVGNPEDLELLFYAIGRQKDERLLHEKFNHLRKRGEWFILNEEMLSYIRLIKCGGILTPFPKDEKQIRLYLPDKYSEYKGNIGTSYGSIR